MARDVEAEDIAAAIRKHGNIWTLQVNNDMQELYEPLHAAQTKQYQGIVESQKALKYGPSERQRLDIYSPISKRPANLLPVVVFFHGGGFVGGDNEITPSMHGHIGNFFANHGCICVLSTYRLLPEARYPSGAEDVTLALQYVQHNIGCHGGDPERITAIGQSAGGAHLAAAIFTGRITAARLKLHGVMLLSAPLWYDLNQERRRKNMLAYHAVDTEEEVNLFTGVSTFKEAKVEYVEPVELLLLLGQYDPEEIVAGNEMFVEAYAERFSRRPLLEVMEGHNHISYYLSLGLPGNTLGSRILTFISDSTYMKSKTSTEPSSIA